MLISNNRLPAHTLQWIIGQVNPEAIVISVQQLQGGVSSLVHGLSLLINGEQVNVVLRQFNDQDWNQREPDLVEHEAESLRRAAETVGVQTPLVIATDEKGNECGFPAILMTRLHGEVVLQPVDVSKWLNGMAQALSQIHAMETTEFPWSYSPYSNASTLDTSTWSRAPEKWKAAADIVTRYRPESSIRFIHRDFHPANVLWSGGEVSGVVDWVNGCIGPAGIDVGHCRVNLAQLYDVRTADEFLASYCHYAGDSFTYEPYWDLVALIDYAYWTPGVYKGWTDLGVTGLTAEMIVERLDHYLMSLLNHFS